MYKFKQTVTNPQELAQAINAAEKTIKETLELSHHSEIDLATKKLKDELELKNQMIAELQANVEKQKKFTRQLTEKTGDAFNQLQSIASKALDEK